MFLRCRQATFSVFLNVSFRCNCKSSTNWTENYQLRYLKATVVFARNISIGIVKKVLGFINVSVPPKLNAFSVDKHLKLGQRVSMLCSATEGDLPMNLRWFRDGVPVESRPQASDLRISITELGAYESVLRIDDLRPEHNANFSCRAENQAGHATHSQKLLVKGKFNYELMKAAVSKAPHCTQFHQAPAPKEY